jgi:hypothetical protein
VKLSASAIKNLLKQARIDPAPGRILSGGFDSGPKEI